MRYIHACTWGIVAVAIALMAGALEAGPEAEDADPSGFAEGLARVESLHERGRAEAGLAALRRLLEDHARQPYVRGRRVEVEDLARRLAFRQIAQIPAPETLVSGTLQSWDPTRGKIKIVYTPDDAGDLEEDEEGERVFPMAIKGPTTIEIEGDRYPSRKGDSPSIRLRGGFNEKQGVQQGFLLEFGVPSYMEGGENAWAPVRLFRYDDDEWVSLFEREDTPAERWEAYKLKLKIGRTSLQAYFNRRSLAKAKKDRDVWGSLWFRCRGWEKVTLSGEVEPSWLQAKAEAALAEQREAFDAAYDAADHLPAWWFEADTSHLTFEDPEARESLPGNVPFAHEDTLDGIFEALEDEEFLDALRLVRTLVDAGVDESVCAYLEGMTRRALGQDEAALACAERLCGLAPTFVDGLLFRMYLLQAMGRREACIEACEAVVAVCPGETAAYETAALSAMYEGDLRQARRFAGTAAEHGAASERLQFLGRALVKAEKGPNWARTYEYKSNNYHVVSDIDRKTCIASARALEECYAAYQRNFGCVGKGKRKRFKVYLFSGRSGFRKYLEEIDQLTSSPTDSLAGLYSPLLKQLLIWNLPRRDAMMATVRHEGFHQYFDRFLENAPTWLDEGLAEYHEDAAMESGHLVFGQVQHNHLATLEKNELVPLDEFVERPHRKFYEVGLPSYAQAWAFVHMLCHGSREQKALLSELIEALQKESDEGDRLASVLPETRLAVLDAQLAEYVASLRR